MLAIVATAEGPVLHRAPRGPAAGARGRTRRWSPSARSPSTAASSRSSSAAATAGSRARTWPARSSRRRPTAPGPQVGERVAGLAEWHGWAEQAAVPSHRLAVVPDEVDFAVAAALPMAGTTAANLVARRRPAARRAGARSPARPAASGHIAVQLAALGGADVTAVARAERADAMRRLRRAHGRRRRRRGRGPVRPRARVGRRRRARRGARARRARRHGPDLRQQLARAVDDRLHELLRPRGGDDPQLLLGPPRGRRRPLLRDAPRPRRGRAASTSRSASAKLGPAERGAGGPDRAAFAGKAVLTIG